MRGVFELIEHRNNTPHDCSKTGQTSMTGIFKLITQHHTTAPKQEANVRNPEDM